MNKEKKTTAWILIMIVTTTASTATTDQPSTIAFSPGTDQSSTTVFTTIIARPMSTATTGRPGTTTSTADTARPTTTTSTKTTPRPATTTITSRAATTTSTTTIADGTTTARSTSTTITSITSNTTTSSTTITQTPRTITITEKLSTTTSTTTTPKPMGTTSTTPTARRRTTKKPSEAGRPLYLTPLLNLNRIADARSRAQVAHPDLTERSYAGYFTVNDVYHSNLFFWYFPAKVNSMNAPVVLYLEGKLGTTAAFSVFVRNGPLVVNSTGELGERADSWNKNHNMLYIDSAVGSGYSFRYRRTVEWLLNQVGYDVAEAVQQFFKLFPNLQKNHFFVAGESFAAPLVTIIANKIHKDNANLEGSGRINLKGIAIGNGVIAPKHQFVFSNILSNVGLVDSNQRKKFETEESKIRTLLERLNPTMALVILGSTILARHNLFHNVTGYGWQYNFNDTQPPAKYNLEFINWLNRTDVRKALHVGDNVFEPYNYRIENSLMLGVLQFKEDLLIHLLDHYRVLIYTGNLDIVCSYSSVLNLLENMPHATQLKNAERKQWFDQSGKLAGYVKKFGNLAEAVVRNAGHFSSIDQPQRTRELLEHFTHGRL